jgi:hypothetical protein
VRSRRAPDSRPIEIRRFIPKQAAWATSLLGARIEDLRVLREIRHRDERAGADAIAIEIPFLGCTGAHCLRLLRVALHQSNLCNLDPGRSSVVFAATPASHDSALVSEELLA